MSNRPEDACATGYTITDSPSGGIDHAYELSV